VDGHTAGMGLPPDRIRPGRAAERADGTFLANGRGRTPLGNRQALAKAEFIVAAELDGAEREARIFLRPAPR